jgi:hypothetical protein
MKSARKIACELGIGINTVCQWAQSNGVEKIGPSFAFTPEQEQAFLDRPPPEKGYLSASEVADRTGKSRAWVCIWADRNGVEKIGRDFHFTDTDISKFISGDGLRRVGRPRKIHYKEESAALAEPVIHHGRGRPRKGEIVIAKPKRPRGRPRKESV